ncbi:hypothetical protein GCM10009069_05690 [Algimonas arctica]|uniref:Type II secretion system protein GspG C-terminal domain-containing protein n=1 Tax=Algimonas arctica TaxID=1479486 RepID=A0A8J3G156_9PROT|nr:type II secretion system protein GspG [Algimonas arctica]GHA85404.1 hypothetical protein GCM10009069_05690 [Algimonas arctica]
MSHTTHISLAIIAAFALSACSGDDTKSRADRTQNVAVEPIADVEPVAQVELTPEQRNFNQRKMDLKKINDALQAYHADNGSYPVTQADGWASVSPTPRAKNSEWLPSLVPSYLAAVPTDPETKLATKSSIYLYKSNGTGYKLIVNQAPDCNLLTATDMAKADPKRMGGGRCWAWGYFTADYAQS